MKAIRLTTGLLAAILFFGFSGGVMGQTTLLTDDFESGDLNKWTDTESHWAASTSSPINGSYSLKHVDNDVAGESSIYTSITATDVNSKVTTWQFNMKNGSWDPSDGNDFSFMLMGDETDPTSGTLNGYVVGVHYSSTGTDDFLILWKVTDGSASAIITSSFDWGSGDLVGIKVERSSSGNWQLFYDSDGDFDNLTAGGSATDTDHTTFSYSGLFFDYTSTRAGELWVDDVLIQQDDETTKAEPADHPSGFTSTGSIKKVDISWTDVSSSPTPDGYLIKGNNTGFGSITDPTDTNTESDDTDLSDGSGVLNVLQGAEEASFSGLDETTTYYFKIYPYTNSGSDINYKTDGTVEQDDATTLETPPIVLNEFLADPATAADPNGDDNPNTTQDEFIEFVNTGTTDLNISDWTIEDAGSTTTHTFPTSTILKPMQALVIFGGGTPAGDFGGAIVQVATGTNLSLNNTGDDIILKNGSGVEIINYSYGSEANSDESVTRNPDLTGDFEQHETADTDDNSSFSPGTRLDGSTFQPSVSITGSEGWRILSTPTSNNTYDDLLGDLWTQGIATGADVTNGTPNVQSFDGTSFSGISDMGATMTSGVGFITYVYSDDDFDGSAEGFPKTLELFAVPKSGSVSPTLTSGANEWTLVGNPYYSTIDWDLLNKTELTGTVYVYDHSYGDPTGVNGDTVATNSAGSYRGWNGSAGSLTDGLISSFQGFWVQNSESATSEALTIEEADKTTGGTFYKESENPPVTIKLRGEMDNMFSESFLSFTENGELEKDNFDGLKLSPLDFRDYLSVATVTGDTKLDINNLPADFEGELEIPLSVNAFTADAESKTWIAKGGDITLSWPVFKNISEDWSLVLSDYETGESINMKELDSYEFKIDGSQQKKKALVASILTPQAPQVEKLLKGTESPRFTITVSKGEATSNEPATKPERFKLEQNYPNPFNPSTMISYQVPEHSKVSLTVFNVMGQQVATLVDETKSAGRYRVSWNAANMASGIYYYRLQAGSEVQTRQMTLIK